VWASAASCATCASGLDYCGAAQAGGHLRADRAQLGHDLAMHRADVAAFGNRGWYFTHKGFFDTKTFATDRHDFSSHPLFRAVF
jgi:hypothetical protein